MTNGSKAVVMAGALLIAAVMGTASAAAAGADTPLWRRVDPSTGAQVTVYRGTGRNVAIDVAGREVSVRKELRGAVVETVIRTPREQVSVRFDGTVLRVAGAGRTLSTSVTDSQGMETVRRRLAASDAISKALTLLGQVNLGMRSPEAHLILTTRVMLFRLLNRDEGRIELARWYDEAATAPKVVRVGDDELTPTECWEAYSREAIAAVDDYRDCLRSKKWYDILGQEACELIYDLRALAAFSWWIRCVTFM